MRLKMLAFLSATVLLAGPATLSAQPVRVDTVRIVKDVSTRFAQQFVPEDERSPREREMFQLLDSLQWELDRRLSALGHTVLMPEDTVPREAGARWWEIVTGVPLPGVPFSLLFACLPADDVLDRVTVHVSVAPETDIHRSAGEIVDRFVSITGRMPTPSCRARAERLRSRGGVVETGLSW
jgi:hypothetical protein